MNNKAVVDLIKRNSSKIARIDLDVTPNDKCGQTLIFSFTDGSEYGVVNVNNCLDDLFTLIFVELLYGELLGIFPEHSLSRPVNGDFSTKFYHKDKLEISSRPLLEGITYTDEFFGWPFAEILKNLPAVTVRTVWE